jgi:hypothetical protein
MEKDLPLIDMNKEHVVRIINYIDSTQNENTKKEIFCRLGTDCFLLGHSKDWGMRLNHDYQKLLDEVNHEGKAPYWEKLEFNKEKTILHLTGKKVTGCVCSFGNSKTPPKSLCLYCCKTFQENLFGTVLNKKVRVEITESSILGGERCSTAIYLE